jgi:predicted RNA-binding protein YlqC (UPF0109 family)
MTKKISKIARSLKQLGEIQVNDWDFMALLHKDIGEFEFSRTLRRMGNKRVIDWDFHSPLPAVNRLANAEVDFGKIFKRPPNSKVLDWDFHRRPPAPAPSSNGPSYAEMQALIGRLMDFTQYVVGNLIEEPALARLSVEEIQTHVLRFRLVLTQRDLAMFLGHGGHTAAALRNLLKSAAAPYQVHALLDILSEQEAAARNGRG